MLVLFTETTVAHPSSFEERAIHACTVHRNKRGSWIPRLLKNGLYTLVLFTETTVAHPSSFEEWAIHACTVHRNYSRSSLVFWRKGYTCLYCSQIQTWLILLLFQRGLCIPVLFTKTNVAHLSSFDDWTIHAWPVHKYKRGSSFVFSRGGYACLYCSQKTNVAHESD